MNASVRSIALASSMLAGAGTSSSPPPGPPPFRLVIHSIAYFGPSSLAPAPRSGGPVTVVSDLERLRGVLPWERELLGPIALELLADLTATNDAAGRGGSHGA